MASAVDYQLLFEHAPGAFLVLRPEDPFTIVAVTDAYLEATMTRREDLVGRGLFDAFPDDPADRDANGVHHLRASLTRVLASGQPDTMAVQRYAVRRVDGVFEERFWSPRNVPVGAPGRVDFIIHRVEDVTAYVRGGGNSAMAAEILARSGELQVANVKLKHDVGQVAQELSEMEARFRQAQKMEAIGQLAGGVAHEFNNLLTVILSCSELLRVTLGPNEPAAADLLDIETAARRAAALTRQLLTFSRKNVACPQSVDLDGVVRESVGLLRRLVGSGILLETVPTPGLRKVFVDRTLVDQVLMNLVVNARDAIGEHGTITLRTANVDLDGHGLLGARGRFAMLSVTDDGAGMDDATRERLFEPFFTTKAPGRGTGLGLAMVYGVIRERGGELRVESRAGGGTTFEVCLPEYVGLDEAAPAPAAPVVERASARVLLIEDEPSVRELSARVLQAAGHLVTAVGTPVEALDRAHDATAAYEVIVSDLVMPQLDGPSLVTRLRDVRSTRDASVVFMSGYAGKARLIEPLDARTRYLAKPFVPSQLLEAVHTALSPAITRP